MKIYLIARDSIPSQIQEDKIESLGEFTFIQATKLSAEEVIAKANDAEILIAGPGGIEKISGELLQGLPNLQFISLLSVGTNWVDLEAAKKRNIHISNIKGANSEAVAEHTWGMILDLSKRISEFARDARDKGVYNSASYTGKEVYGKTFGVIGLGDIGTKVARIAKGFDMRVLGNNRSGKVVDGVELVNLQQLLKLSDIVAVCLPLTNETTNLIAEKEIELMKKGAILVNCARHGIVNKQAALQAIREKKLFGYGVETEIMEPLSSDDEYFKYPNILVTPHNAYNTFEAEKKTFDTVIQNIQAYITGKPINLVV